MHVELFYRDGDPRVMEVRQRLVEVLSEDAFETPIQLIALERADDAASLGIPGSPTVRIDGNDIHPVQVEPSLEDRRFSSDAELDGPATEPLPGPELIRRAVERARGWAHRRRAGR